MRLAFGPRTIAWLALACSLGCGTSGGAMDAALDGGAMDADLADAPSQPTFTGVCHALLLSPTLCTDPCHAIPTDPMITVSYCQTAAAAAQASSEAMAFTTCIAACSTARTCPVPDGGSPPDAGSVDSGGGGMGGMAGGSGGRTVLDCDCGDACLRAQSPAFQALVDAVAPCLAMSSGCPSAP